MVDAAIGGEPIPQAEVGDVELYHPHSWITKYVFCQDAKVIAIQYSDDRIVDRTRRARAVVADAIAARLSLARCPSSTPSHYYHSSPCTA